MRQASKHQRGFTLMEATVALAVFTIGMLGLGGTFSQIIRANAISRHKQTAALLAEHKLAQFRMAETGTLTQTSGTFEVPFDDYAWEARFNSQSDDLGILDVWVEVTHRSGAGAQLWSQVAMPDDN